ncbi:unnamed protein product [Pedinophyceae sp. YPF-701]|nr:unnamed protein product [Pedinophyceae sp. YPF-701]
MQVQSPIPNPALQGRTTPPKRARTVANSNAQPGKKPRTGGEKHSGRETLGTVSPNRSGQRIPDQLHESRPSLAASGGTGTNTATEERRTASDDVDASTSYKTGLPPADAAVLRRELTPEEIAGVKGMKQTDAADELGVTIDTLRKRCGTLGIKWRRRADELTPEEIAGVFDMKQTDAADELGVSVATLRKRCGTLGIKWRRRVDELTPEEIAGVFDMKQTDAADELGVTIDTLKKRCGTLGIKWRRFAPILSFRAFRQGPTTSRVDAMLDDILHDTMMVQNLEEIAVERTGSNPNPRSRDSRFTVTMRFQSRLWLADVRRWLPEDMRDSLEAARDDDVDDTFAAVADKHSGIAHTESLRQQNSSIYMGRKQGGDACVIPKDYDPGELELLQTKPGFYLTMVCLRDLVADGEGLSTEEVEALEGEQFTAYVWDYLGIYQGSFFARHVNHKHEGLDDGLWRLVFPVICECPGVVERLGLQVIKFPTNSQLNWGKTRLSRADVEAFVPVGTKKLQGDVITPKHVNDACDEIKAAAAAAGQRLVDAGESGRVLRALQRESGLLENRYDLPKDEIRDLGARRYDKCGVIKLWVGLTTLAEFLEDSENARALKDQAGPGRAQQLRKMMLDPLQGLVSGCDETWSLQKVLDALQ